MARELRIARPGGRYHVTARGNEREKTFRGDTDGFRFVEQAGRENWVGVVKCHGDWRRDAALGLGRRAGGLRLAEFGQLAGGLDYAVVSQSLARLAHRLAWASALSGRLAAIENQLSL